MTTEPSGFPVGFIADADRKRLGFYGKGSLELQAGRLHLEARRLPGYWALWGGVQSFSVPLEAVCDVQTEQSTLFFTLNSPGQPWSGRVQRLLLPDAEEAKRLAQALPATVQVATAQLRSELLRFQTALLRANPNSHVSTAIISLCLLAFVFVWLWGGQFWEAAPAALLRLGAGHAPYSLHGQPWRLLTGSFLHASVLHLALNLYAMLQIAPLVERLYGSPRFTLLYGACSLCGGLCSALYYPVSIAVGASGAVLGLYGALMAYALRFPRSLPKGYAREFVTTGLIFITLTLAQGYSHEHVDNAAHWGGLISGLVMGSMLSRELV